MTFSEPFVSVQDAAIQGSANVVLRPQPDIPNYKTIRDSVVEEIELFSARLIESKDLN
jgi:hypothetical protein